MSKLSSFAKNYVKDIGLSALDILKQNITGTSTGVLPKQTAIEAENLAAGLTALGSSYNNSIAIVRQNVEANSNRSPYSINPVNSSPPAVMAAKGYSLSDQSSIPEEIIVRASNQQNIRSFDLVTYTDNSSV